MTSLCTLRCVWSIFRMHIQTAINITTYIIGPSDNAGLSTQLGPAGTPRGKQSAYQREPNETENSENQRSWEDIYDSFVRPRVEIPGERTWEDVYDSFYTHPYDPESTAAIGAHPHPYGKFSQGISTRGHAYAPESTAAFGAHPLPYGNFSQGVATRGHTSYYGSAEAAEGFSIYCDYSSDYPTTKPTGYAQYRRRYGEGNGTTTIHRNPYRPYRPRQPVPQDIPPANEGIYSYLNKHHDRDFYDLEGRKLDFGQGDINKKNNYINWSDYDVSTRIREITILMADLNTELEILRGLLEKNPARKQNNKHKAHGPTW